MQRQEVWRNIATDGELQLSPSSTEAGASSGQFLHQPQERARGQWGIGDCLPRDHTQDVLAGWEAVPENGVIAREVWESWQGLCDSSPQRGGDDLGSWHLHWPGRQCAETEIPDPCSLAQSLQGRDNKVRGHLDRDYNYHKYSQDTPLESTMTWLAAWTSIIIPMTCSCVLSGVTANRILNLRIIWLMHFHRFESYGYTNEELNFQWNESGNNVNDNISLAQFDVKTSLVARLA